MRKIIFKIYALAYLIIFYSCADSCNVDKNVDFAIEQSYKNGKELKKVLAHYSDSPFKRKAAEFLIANMPGHYSYSRPEKVSQYYALADSFVSGNPGMPYAQICDSVSHLYQQFNIDRIAKVNDCEIISADYLIDNIDAAFNQWKNNPWLSHLTFDQFCEYVLPYKVAELQPLDGWRTDFMNSYKDLLDGLRYCDLYNGSAYRACKTLNDAYKQNLNPRVNNQGNLPVKDISVRMKVPFGTCRDFVYITTAVFRSVGLPVAQDCTPHWANIRLGHSWNVLLAQNGKTVPFVGMLDKMDNGQIIDERPPKVFRKTYASNKELRDLNRSGGYVPAFFRDIFQKDVTSEYISTADIEIDCSRQNNKYAFLCVFGDNDWTPVHFAPVTHGGAIFKDMARNVVYLPVVYTINGGMKPLGAPFLLKHDGTTHAFDPGENTRHAKIYRKSPALRYTWDYAKLAKGGEFEASNDPGFKGRVCHVHTIPTGYAISWEMNVSDTVPPCRYWRYIHRGNETYCSMADIFFYGKDKLDAPLSGKIIGTEGSWENNPQWSRENLFDGDPLTSYCAPSHTGCWVGLDFGKPTKVSKLRYTPRGDGNMIEVGDCYELFYWDNERWASLGRKAAATVYVEYSFPDNAILLLRDVTKGHEERIFTIDRDGTQVWR